MNARVTQGLALLLAKVMEVTDQKRIESYVFLFFCFCLRFLSAIYLWLWDHQYFEGQKLFPYRSIAAIPSRNSFERQALGACSLLPFAGHQQSRSHGSSGCHAFCHAQPSRFTSPRRSSGTHERVGHRGSAGTHTHSACLEAAARGRCVCLWVPKHSDHSVHLQPPKDMWSPLSLKKTQ